MLVPTKKIYLASTPVDMRKSYQTLSILVETEFKGNPLSGHFFVFYNKSYDRLKILYWDQTGLCLWQKRLESGCFQFPVQRPSPHLEITTYQLQGLIQGLAWTIQAEKQKRYRLVS